jgi:predicted house-cleaning noncanonical NTP pyrophosphatase (MazG superfamily)
MKELMNLKQMLCEELEEYGRSPELSKSSLEMIDKLAHACKNVCKIIEAKDEEQYSREGGSYRGGSYGDGSYYGGGRYSRDGYYYDDGGMSHRRGRDRMGRFTSRDASEMAHKLREMMEEAPDEASKREIQRLADKMESM